MDSTRYVLIFTLIMTSVSALLLSTLFFATKDKAKENEAIFNKRAVLLAVETELSKEVGDMSDEEVVDLFNKQITQTVVNMEGEVVAAEQVEAAGYKGGQAEHIDMAKEKKKPEAERILPLFTFDSGKDKFYIVSVRGSGLWDEIWGSIAIKSDFNTLAGAAFDHKGETPGLGAEIKDNPSFRQEFAGKKLYDENGTYVSITVVKGGVKNATYEVDAISGATVTSVGVAEMLQRGIKYYEAYFNSLKEDKKMGLAQ